MHPVLVAGNLDEVADLIDRTRRTITDGCIPDASTTDLPHKMRGVPVVGGLPNVPELVQQGDYRILAVAPDTHRTRRRFRELAWDLEGIPTDLMVAPALMEVTRPQLHVAPVHGLTLLRVSQPTFRGAGWVLKGALDRVAAPRTAGVGAVADRGCVNDQA